MMIESKILSLLQKKVTEVVGKSYKVKYINTNIGNVDKFWEIVYIPNNVENEFWDKGKTYRGILRLILHWPQDNKGIYKPMEEAGVKTEASDREVTRNFAKEHVMLGVEALRQIIDGKKTIRHIRFSW